MAHFPFLLRELTVKWGYAGEIVGSTLPKSNIPPYLTDVQSLKMCSKDFLRKTSRLKSNGWTLNPSHHWSLRRLTQTPWVWSYLDRKKLIQTIFYLSRYDWKTRETFEKLSRQPAIESHGCPGTEVRIKGLGSVGDFTPNITPFYT